MRQLSILVSDVLLGALEKGDAEALARLRSTHEIDLLTAVREVKQAQVREAQATLDGLVRGRRPPRPSSPTTRRG
jgi:hypothetical protein